ncbi:hypothetical protein DAPPUDRAFT_96377 [Daphnia pulex]|uniref:Uncharacterized protein n=1 Tax=Daphnia pulex TaxID=6669 RepID=E9FXQ9_DAPPU|nr:hypothetical protein DAPPUDRAFT_96377 [Daphnia pulex]|eukprot:EFX88139.1 hypothetical protein DAPPUDRAFT_96377 [Daphnia pulex]
MPCNSSFPALKPLPGSKKSFPDVCSRVNSGRVNLSKLDQTPMTIKASRQVRIHNSSGSELFFDHGTPLASKRFQPKPGTHYDSSAVSACLNQQTCKSSKTTNLRSKIPARKPIVSCVESSKPKWNSATLFEPKKVTAGISPLPGKKKTLNDFMGKQFRATPAPPTTHKPSMPVAPNKRQSVRDVNNIIHLDPAEEAEFEEFELTERAVLQQVDAQKEITPSRSLKKIRSGKEDVVCKERSLVRSLEDIILREVSRRKTAL